MNQLQKASKAAFDLFWSIQSKKGDPSRNPILTQDAFNEGFYACAAAGFDRSNTNEHEPGTAQLNKKTWAEIDSLEALDAQLHSRDMEVLVLRKALKRLSFAAQTYNGTGETDATLQAAIDKAGKLLKEGEQAFPTYCDDTAKALNTLARLMHSGEEFKDEDDILCFAVSADLWWEADDALCALIGDDTDYTPNDNSTWAPRS